jgi:hypothetical protein
VEYKADLLNLRTPGKLKLSHLSERGADQAAASERQKIKITLSTGHLPGKTMTELLLEYQHQNWMLEE